ncbi:hypothetical protein DENSPDRAFT_882116 [Dentipellis sp. KUC8613]|nr:hypothetical protein DENSPDRAFT_882116 [Dentipellis sp. KUC8613]
MRPQLPLPALSSLAQHLLHLVAPCHRPLHPLEPTAALVHLNAVVTCPKAARTRRTAALAPQRDPLVTTTTLSRLNTAVSHLNAAVSRLNAAVSRTSSPSRTCHLTRSMPPSCVLSRPNTAPTPPSRPSPPPSRAHCPPPPSNRPPIALRRAVRSPPTALHALSAAVRRSRALCALHHPLPPYPPPFAILSAARRALYPPPAPSARHLRLCAVCAPSARTLHVLQPPSPALSATSARATARRGCEGGNGPTRLRGRDDAPMRARRGHGDEGATRASRAVPALSATFARRMSPPRTVRALCHPVRALRRLLVPSPPLSAASTCLRRLQVRGLKMAALGA